MRLVLLPLVAFVAACSCPGPKEPPASGGTPPQAPPPPSVPVERLRGFVTTETGPLTFTPCGQQAPLRVVGGAEAELRQVLAGFGPVEGAPPVNVEVVGATRALAGSGGMASIEALNIVLPPGNTSLCDLDDSYQFRASGTEPFWSLVVIGEQLRYDAMGVEQTLELAVTPLRIPGSSGPAWRGEGDGHVLELQLVPERCTDGMAGAIYPLRAHLTLNGQVLGGCAHQGWDAAP